VAGLGMGLRGLIPQKIGLRVTSSRDPRHRDRDIEVMRLFSKRLCYLLRG
jgi:hypothetical protein